MLRPVLALGLVSWATSVLATDWPQFRGPNGNGLVAAATAPESWDEQTNVAWAIDVPGEGWSAPIVVGGRVLLTTAVPTEADAGVMSFEVHSYDLATGELQWKRVARTAEPTEPTHRDNTYASETPVSDGERVYAYFGMNGLYAFTLDGEPIWQTDLGAFPMANGWGTSSSPAIAGDKLIVQIDNERDSHVVAVNTADGSEAWRVARPDEVSTWSTPLVWENSERTEVILGGKTIRSYDPETGDELWSMYIGGRSSASPSAIDDTLYIGSENRTRRGGTPGGLFAVRAGASGEIDVTDPAAKQQGLLWANERGSIGIASPLVYDGQIYVPERRGGVLRVHDAATGEQSYRTRLPGGGVFWASPLAINGNVYVMDESGKTFILAPGPEYELLGTSELPGRFWSTPAIADGALLIRSQHRLFCVR
ncbi:MAG: PQQ-binding-like beta-propeller repeat protein [Planctomycetota bacterium]